MSESSESRTLMICLALSTRSLAASSIARWLTEIIAKVSLYVGSRWPDQVGRIKLAGSRGSGPANGWGLLVQRGAHREHVGSLRVVLLGGGPHGPGERVLEPLEEPRHVVLAALPLDHEPAERGPALTDPVAVHVGELGPQLLRQSLELQLR